MTTDQLLTIGRCSAWWLMLLRTFMPHWFGGRAAPARPTPEGRRP